MRFGRKLRLCGVAVAMALAASPAMAQGYSFLGDWPTRHTFADGTDFGVGGLYQYDVNDFSHDGGLLRDAHTNRRKYFGAYLKKKGVYDAKAEFDFQSKKWQDAYLRVQSKALLGKDVGAFRIGQGKLPVGFEGNTSTNAATFIESALPTQAVYENRRVGVDWTLLRPAWLAALGYYGGDLQGDNDGHTLAGRVAWAPWHQPGDVLHLGLAASRESPESSVNGLGLTNVPSARFRSTPEAGLSPLYLVDSGALKHVDEIDRYGLEGLWIRGSWSLQGEYLHANTSFDDGKPAYRIDGWYAFASWVATGESRPYKDGNVGNVAPSRPWGAVELLLRYSTLDLDDGAILGGREHDWTLGANWYLGQHLKLQANYIRAFSDRKDLAIDPRIVELRAQIAF
ncbi:MAG: porin [Xanthomonadales bacterium]|nr:porin [Xanthomonadales bacterium]ODU91834.1 MAG: porin [Rhodanobacter sp. SCN 66-43]OJY84864.1 MAG: porin [Xanthomonadales bacterium 66-474]